MASDPSFTIGIEEEYLLVDLDTMTLAEAPQALMEDSAKALEGQVSPEFLRCQIEVGTQKCATIAEAREDLARLRGTLSRLARNHGLAPIAASCHPTADWKEQHTTPKDRYDALKGEMALVAERQLVCGMHVHIGLDEDERRIDLMNQASYFLPHILALSASSPFWRGSDTGLDSYRVTVFDNMPRTGLPPRFSSWTEYRRSVDTLIDCGVIEDTTKIWWDIRPAHHFPTLETRICDVVPRLDHAVSIAAIVQCVMRMLCRLRRSNQRWRIYDAFLVSENRWRAQRYGTEAELIDFGRGELVPYRELLEELLGILEQDARALGCHDELMANLEILRHGNSAARQRAVYTAARADGCDNRAALARVTEHLVEEFTAGL
jgi:carboxylate-amine ligase